MPGTKKSYHCILCRANVPLKGQSAGDHYRKAHPEYKVEWREGDAHPHCAVCGSGISSLTAVPNHWRTLHPKLLRQNRDRIRLGTEPEEAPPQQTGPRVTAEEIVEALLKKIERLRSDLEAAVTERDALRAHIEGLQAALSQPSGSDIVARAITESAVLESAPSWTEGEKHGIR